MIRILHISDLHFGRVRADLADPLVTLTARLQPDLVVVSGDLTQRARRHQFAAAAAFLARLPAPWLAVPGNHDVPLDNLWLRFVDPWGRWRSYISPDLAPGRQSGGLTVLGLNTVNRFAWQAGRIGRGTLARIRAAATDDGVMIVVMHHPLEHPPGDDRPAMRGVRRAIAALGEAGADIVLSGHLHNSHVAPLASAPGILLVQAGTGLSTRLSREMNTVNLVSIDGEEVTIDRYAAADRPEFAIVARTRFHRTSGGWRPLTVPDQPLPPDAPALVPLAGLAAGGRPRDH